MQRSSTFDYEIRTAAGELLYTSPHRDLALRYARNNACMYPGLRLDEVERVVIHRRIYTDRANLRLVG